MAAVAEARGLTVLHYDADFELVAEVTGQPHQWVVPSWHLRPATGSRVLDSLSASLRAGLRHR